MLEPESADISLLTLDYKSLFLQAEERWKQVEERQKQAEGKGKRERERREQAEERTRQTTFIETMCYSHNFLSQQLRVETPSRLTAGQIPLPTGKYCLTQLSQLYTSVCRYFILDLGDLPRLFPPLLELEGLCQQINIPLSYEEELWHYKQLAMEDHVCDIITKLCKLPAARDKFSLGDGTQFSSHANLLNETKAIASQPSCIPEPKPDQYSIHHVIGNVPTVITSVKYKPPYKLPVATLCMGLYLINLWKAMVKSNKIPTNLEVKLKYSMEWLAWSTIVQEYHVIIQEGLEYSYVVHRIARVLLHVPQDNPSTLYYFFYNPNSKLDPDVDHTSLLLRTFVAITLYLCLLAFRSPTRSQEWRGLARKDLGVWKTSFNYTYSYIPKAKRQQAIPYSNSTALKFPSLESGLAYLPLSPPVSPTASGRGVTTRSQASCAPPATQHRSQSPDSSGSNTNATGRKRGFSQVTSLSLPSAQRAARQHGISDNQGILDKCCPNVLLHCQGHNNLQCPTTLKDEKINWCIPLGSCGVYGTTSGLWKEVSREKQVYQLLRKTQGSALPVFLGIINQKKVYFLHGAGEIHHMLMELLPRLCQEICRSEMEIKSLRIIHKDLWCDNILWNIELGWALIIDFHRSALRSQLIS
ncbi:hypothetical protein BDV19DRAFT_383458 [Aspergillus venezuelensis]